MWVFCFLIIISSPNQNQHLQSETLFCYLQASVPIVPGSTIETKTEGGGWCAGRRRAATLWGRSPYRPHNHHHHHTFHLYHLTPLPLHPRIFLHHHQPLGLDPLTFVLIPNNLTDITRPLMLPLLPHLFLLNLPALPLLTSLVCFHLALAWAQGLLKPLVSPIYTFCTKSKVT
ncbi:hypothetical protein HanHA300_Chr09g0323461 [Helianthus annuus]|nr:hypothetical protein HanHA300_Chr09g0323461 [Helianthus annuus]KAJ0542850.1 hypothetical protein HanHA89_Chr09g0344371 [Helianthus annuus]KAJ0707905.1 hypothetical protein HanLR1_Chr09g0323701 [Helianthus annuus]